MAPQSQHHSYLQTPQVIWLQPAIFSTKALHFLHFCISLACDKEIDYIFKIFKNIVNHLITWFFWMSLTVALCTNLGLAFWTLYCFFGAFIYAYHYGTFWVWAPFEIWVLLDLNVVWKCLIFLEHCRCCVLLYYARGQQCRAVWTLHVLYSEVEDLLLQILRHTIQANLMHSFVNNNKIIFLKATTAYVTHNILIFIFDSNFRILVKWLNSLLLPNCFFWILSKSIILLPITWKASHLEFLLFQKLERRFVFFKLLFESYQLLPCQLLNMVNFVLPASPAFGVGRIYIGNKNMCVFTFVVEDEQTHQLNLISMYFWHVTAIVSCDNQTGKHRAEAEGWY